jgi:PAS domain-containing protein
LPLPNDVSGFGKRVYLRPGVGSEAMTVPQIDYAAVYRDFPIPVLLLTPEFVIADVNVAYLQVAGRTREELLGRNVFDAFPDNPADPDASGVRDLSASLARVLTTGAWRRSPSACASSSVGWPRATCATGMNS